MVFIKNLFEISMNNLFNELELKLLASFILLFIGIIISEDINNLMILKCNLILN